MDAIPVSKLKAEALAIVEWVATRGEEVTITKRGKPVVKLVPITKPAGLLGSVRFLVPDEEIVNPIDVHWDAERGR